MTDEWATSGLRRKEKVWAELEFRAKIREQIQMGCRF
jgi:hypothetical protein